MKKDKNVLRTPPCSEPPESAPRGSEDALQYWRLIESMNDAAYVVGQDMKFMEVNSRAAEMLGYSREELLAMGPADIDSHLSAKTISSIVRRVRAGGKSVEETVHRTKDGSLIPVEIALTPAPYMGQKTVLAIVRDISSRKLVESSLVEITRRNQALLQTIPDIIAEVDINKVYTWVNEAGLEFFGDDVIGKEAAYYFVDSKDTYGEVSPLFSGVTDNQYVESWQRRKDGENRCLIWWCRSLKDEDGNVIGALSTARDITDRRREEVTRDARLRLLELDPDLSVQDFLQAALRELQTLTSSTTSFCKFLIEEREFFTVAARERMDAKVVGEPDAKGSRHAISGTEIWAECVKKRQPVINNHVPKTLGREAIAPKHPQFERLLTVPVLRADKLVAIFGMANKPTDYTQQDVETAASFIDLLWDTVAHKQTEAELQDSDALNRRLFDASPDPVFLSEPGGHFLDCNQTAVDTYGYSREEFLDMTYADLAAPGVRDRAGEHVEETLEHGGKVFTWRHRRKDGTELPVEIRTVPFVAQGQQRIMASVRDLTQAREAEEALRRSEAEFRALFEAAPIGVCVADLEGNILAFNDAALTRGGYSRDDIHKLRKVEHVYYDQEERQQVISLFAAQGSLTQHEVRFKRRDGTPYDAVLSLNHTTFDGQPCIQAIFEDHTEKKNAERALQQSEERFKTLSAMASEGIMIHEGGVIVDANLAFAQFAGVSDPDELVGKMGIDIPVFSSETRQQIEDHMRSGSEEVYEIEFTGPDGTTRWAQTGATEITYRDRPARLVFVRDITDSKRAQAEHERLETQLRQAAKMESVGRLAGGVAHDYNNMLAVILGHVDLALGQVPGAGTLHEDLVEIRKAADRSASITKQLLAFARRQATTPEVLDLNSEVAGMLVMLRRLMGDQVKLEWKPDEDHAWIEIDPAQLDQILVNLCLNARDAIPEFGRIKLATRQTTLDDEDCKAHDGCSPGDYLVLSITDDGIGMTPHALEHMFEPFFTTKELGEGTGLGLSTVYGIVHQNNGFIEVESTEGQGTEVRIYFPQVDAPVREPSSADDHPDALGGDETLLVIEDEPSVLHLVTKILQDLGYQVLATDTPQEALRVVREHPGDIDLAITDVIMPEMRGWELVERMRELRPGLRTIYASGYAHDAFPQDERSRQSDDFLQKPFTPEQLARTVREALDRE